MIDRASDLIRRANQVVTFSGAGLSAESGVPTFRDAQTGLWATYDPMQLASPEGFRSDPDRVIAWYDERRVQLASARPNPAHAAMAAQSDLVHITQNVDDLLERAGTPREQVIHLHGSIDVDRCHASSCDFRETIDLASPPGRRQCPKCSDALRPGVVWFGELLPQYEWSRAVDALSACDLLIVIGTSGTVYPAAGLVDVARENGATLIVVNTEPTPLGRAVDVELVGPAGSIIPRLFDLAAA